MSSQLKEKQQQTDKSREFEADQLFNKHLFRTLAYAGAGFGAGMVASLFFKHKKMITLLGTGAGAAYGGQGFMSDLNQYKRFKDLGSQSQQSNTLKREDQLATKNWEDFMPKQESLSQQKRYGGSSDDNDNENKGSKSNSETKGTSSKSSEKKGHEATATRPQTQSKSPSESLHTSSHTGTKIDQSKTSSHNKDMDKSSHQFGKNKGESAKDSSHDRTTDKSSQQFGNEKSSGVKSFNSNESVEKNKKAETTKDHKQSDLNKHEPQKSSSQSKQHEKDNKQHERTGKPLEKDSKQLEKTTSGVRESHFDYKEQGQQLQDFKSNKDAGKPAPGESELYRGSERPKQSSNRSLDDMSNQQNKAEQDRWGKSRRTGNKMKEEFAPENIAGGQFSGTGLTARSHTETVME